MIAVVDTSIWLAAIIRHEPGSDEALNFVNRILVGEHRSVAPVSVFVEIASAAGRRLKDKKRHIAEVEEYLQVLRASPDVRWQSLDLATANEAAAVGLTHGLRGMDAFVAATAIMYNLPLLTEDHEFQRVADVVTVLSLQDTARWA